MILLTTSIALLLCLALIYGQEELNDLYTQLNFDVTDNIPTEALKAPFVTASADSEPPSFAPTILPTMGFTIEPTEEPVFPPLALTAFVAAQVLNSIGANTYNSEYDLNTMVMTETIAMCMTGIYPHNITEYEVTALDASTLMTSYLVSSNKTDTNYETLSNELTTCVHSGQFNNLLHANAASASATALVSVTCNFISVVDTQSIDVPTAAPTEEPTMEFSEEPTQEPSVVPTNLPSFAPSRAPTVTASIAPTLTEQPTQVPTQSVTLSPTTAPFSSLSPSRVPTTLVMSSTSPTTIPSTAHTSTPTNIPSAVPSATPTALPTYEPSPAPTEAPTTAVPSHTPTIRPSVAPSVSPAPTGAPVVQIAATQTINGISFDTYNTNPSLYASVLKKTIADCLDGISPEDITNLVVSSAVSAQLRSETSTAGTIHRRLQTNAIRTSYIVRTSNAALSYQTLSSQLASAVTNGVFDTLLSVNAQDAGATELVGCQSSEVSTVPIDTSSGSAKKSLSAGAIAGIVIGCVVGVGLMIAAAVLLTTRMKKVSPPEGQRNFELHKVLPG